MTVYDTIRAKRAVRHFAAQPISEESLRRILNAGRLAGSSKNTQPWMFIAIRDRERLKALSECGTYAAHLAGANVGVALLTPDPAQRWSIMFDLGQAAQNMMLTAWELGIGSVMATIYEPEKARSLLGFPEEWHIRAAISFGYPSYDPASKPSKKGMRRTFDDVVKWERW
jgi:nitroreductase